MGEFWIHHHYSACLGRSYPSLPPLRRISTHPPLDLVTLAIARITESRTPALPSCLDWEYGAGATDVARRGNVNDLKRVDFERTELP